jgi:hypothetical protein
LGKLDGLRNASTGTTNTDMVEGMKTMLRSMRNDNIGIIENVDDIQVIESTGTGHQMTMEAIHYWDDSVERLVNGSTRPTGLGGSKTGARAQAETEEDSSEAHYQPARDTGDAVINRDLIGWFISQPLNRENLRKLGLADAKRPVFHSRQEKKEAIADILASATMFMQNGLPLVQQEVYERAGGWSVPGPDDQTVSGMMPMGAGDMVGDLSDPDSINSNAQKNIDADRKAKNKPKPAKMDEDIGLAAKFDEFKMEIKDAISRGSERGGTHVHLADGMKLDVPAPIVNFTAPEPKVIVQAPERIVIPAAQAPVVQNNIQAPIIPPAQVVVQTAKFDDSKSVSALEKIGNLLEKAVSVFSFGGKKKTTTVKERDAQGNITKFETEERD